MANSYVWNNLGIIFVDNLNFISLKTGIEKKMQRNFPEKKQNFPIKKFFKNLNNFSFNSWRTVFGTRWLAQLDIFIGPWNILNQLLQMGHYFMFHFIILDLFNWMYLRKNFSCCCSIFFWKIFPFFGFLPCKFPFADPEYGPFD